MTCPFIIYLKNKTSLKFEYKSDISTVLRTDKGYRITFNSGKTYNYGADKVKFYPLISTRKNIRIYDVNISKETLIYPFGCNESQKMAVETTLRNSISIVEGPPRTGKTQTILNIIANLIVQDKTVAIVSNNNSAVFNAREKLEKYGY